MNLGTTMYRAAALQGASQLDLTIAVYDAIAENLRHCATAVSGNDIAGRCRATERAMLLLGHLESWLAFLNDQPLEKSLLQFYAYLRAEILRLQTTSEPQNFIDLALEVSYTRAAWQKRFALPRHAPEVVVQSATSPESRMTWTA